MPLEKNCPSLCLKSFTCKQENCFLSLYRKLQQGKSRAVLFLFFNYSFHYYNLSILFWFSWPVHPYLRKGWVFTWHETTVEPQYNEGPRNWQIFFAMWELGIRIATTFIVCKWDSWCASGLCSAMIEVMRVVYHDLVWLFGHDVIFPEAPLIFVYSVRAWSDVKIL